MTPEDREEIDVLREKVRLLKEWIELKERLEEFKPNYPPPRYIPVLPPYNPPYQQPWSPWYMPVITCDGRSVSGG
jgi:hypothetical protein